MSVGQLDILNVGRGHLKLTITEGDAVEVEKARRIIEDMMARGFAIFVETEDGGTRRVKRFDPKRMVYLIDDTLETVPAAAAEATPPAASAAPVLYVDERNGSILCETCVGPVKHSDCFDFSPLTPAETAEWLVLVEQLHGAGARLCEWCRAKAEHGRYSRVSGGVRLSVDPRDLTSRERAHAAGEAR